MEMLVLGLELAEKNNVIVYNTAFPCTWLSSKLQIEMCIFYQLIHTNLYQYYKFNQQVG